MQSLGTVHCGDRFYASRKSGIGEVEGFKHGLVAAFWLGAEIKIGSLVPSPPPFLSFGLCSVYFTEAEEWPFFAILPLPCITLIMQTEEQKTGKPGNEDTK